MTDFRRVARPSEVPSGGMLEVEIDDHELVVADVGGKYYAFDNICRCIAHFAGHKDATRADPHTHGGRLARLGHGTLQDGAVTCPEHGTRYDVRTGSPSGGPGEAPVSTFEVKVEGDDLMVAIMADSERHFWNDSGHRNRP